MSDRTAAEEGDESEESEAVDAAAGAEARESPAGTDASAVDAQDSDAGSTEADVAGDASARSTEAGNQATDATTIDATEIDSTAAEDLLAQVELLQTENRRLREAYASAWRSRYRRAAIGLALVGVTAVAAGAVFPAGREVLFVLGATGLFGGLLTYYLTPERFVAADVGERVYRALATNEEAVVDELGLRDERVYLPAADATGPRLFVPQRAEFEFPEARSRTFVTDDASRGLLLTPTGAGLYEAFESGVVGSPDSTPGVLAAQLADALVAQFELARSVESDVDLENQRVTFAVSGGAFEPLDRIDNPIASFLTVGVASGLDRPVALEVSAGDARADWLVTCRWDDEAIGGRSGTVGLKME